MSYAVVLQERATNAFKKDLPDVANAKKTKRRHIQKELNEHLRESEHIMVDAASFLPSIDLPDELVMNVGQQVDLLPELKQPERDVELFIVGHLAPHKRMNMKKKKVNDFIILSYTDDTTEELQFGVAMIVEILNEIVDGSLPQYKIHWFQSNDDDFTKAYLPLWNEVKAGKRTYAGAKQHNSHKAYCDVITDDGQILAHGGLCTKHGKLKLKYRRILCGVEECDYKIEGHDDECEC